EGGGRAAAGDPAPAAALGPVRRGARVVEHALRLAGQGGRPAAGAVVLGVAAAHGQLPGRRGVQVLAGGGGPSVKITGAGPWSPGGAAMSRQDLLPWVFCPTGDGSKAPHPPRPRARGRRVTTPTDAGVITTEPVGGFRGLGADEAIYRHSRAYHAAGFPDPDRVRRTTPARRAADPRAVERAPHRRPAEGPSAGRPVRPVDGFPPPVRPGHP